MALAALFFCLGVAIGLRFSLLALLPAILGILCLQVLGGDGGNLQRVGAAILQVVSIQGGYMIGLTGRDLVRSTFSRLSAALRSS